MLTVEEIAAYLRELGLTIPAPILECLINKAASIQPCLDGAGYSECDQKLIYYYLVGMMAISSGARRIKSQGAPSGASRSFEYGSITEQMRQLRNLLNVLDTSGCSTDLQPADPGGQAGLWVGRAVCADE